MISQKQIEEKLRLVKYPGFSRDIVSFGLVQTIQIHQTKVEIHLRLTTSDSNVPRQIEAEARRAIQTLPQVKEVVFKTEITAPLTAAMQAGGGMQSKIEGVRHVVAVASGKGGVGKSTIAANLAAALSRLGMRAGLCDCDIYGPSVALMYGVQKERPTVTEDEKISPIIRHGVKLMSMGFLLEDDAPAVLRGPMVTRYTQQFLRHVAWGELDLLVLDLPPGTGDIQLTIVQTIALDGAIIVTTPQEVALIDARKAASMFGKVNVPILGLVENMSYFICPNDGNRYDIFGQEGGRKEAARLNVPLLAQVPIDMEIRACGDEGVPVVKESPQSPISEVFMKMAHEVKQILDQKRI